MTKSARTTAAAEPATRWPEFAATYRRAIDAFNEAIKVDTRKAQDRAIRAYNRAFTTLLDYPVTTPAELAEKVELVFLVEAGPDDIEKIEPALKRDAAAVASGAAMQMAPAGRTWLACQAAWVASVETMKAQPTDEALDAEAAAWGDMIQTEAPSLCALLMKFEAVLACYLAEAGASLHSADTVAKLAADKDCMGPGPLIAMWRDLQRLVGVSDPISPAGA